MSATGAIRQAKIDVTISYEQRADAATSAVARRLLAVIADDLEGAIADEDIEYLHQLRIAVRRSRTIQRQLRGVFPALELPGYRSDFRWLQRATGRARDLDVYVEDFDSLAKLLPADRRDDLAPLREVLVHAQGAARGQLAMTLRSPRVEQLLEDWERLLESLVELPLDDRPAARRSVGSLTGERVVAVYERIVKMGSRIDKSSPAESYHELRKKGKELRYLLELFAVRVFEPAVVEDLIRSLKGLQDLLGLHQDREVQREMLHAFGSDVAVLPGGAAACMAMGTLTERLAADEIALRGKFSEAFARLAAAPQRAAVRETFR